MKNKVLFGKLLFGAAILFTSPVSAQSATSNSSLEVSGNVGLFSEYAFRGISQSDESFALQGGFDVAHENGLYAGVWGSNVDFNDGDQAHIEIDLYGGYSGSLDNMSYDIGAIYYTYPGANSSLDYDFVEVAVGAGYDFGNFEANASVNYSPEYFGDSGDAFYYAASVDVPVTQTLSASAHIGHQTIDDNTTFGTPDYTDWSLGLNYAWEGFDASLQYVDTDLSEPGECGDGCEERIIFGLSKSF